MSKNTELSVTCILNPSTPVEVIDSLVWMRHNCPSYRSSVLSNSKDGFYDVDFRYVFRSSNTAEIRSILESVRPHVHSALGGAKGVFAMLVEEDSKTVDMLWV